MISKIIFYLHKISFFFLFSIFLFFRFVPLVSHIRGFIFIFILSLFYAFLEITGDIYTVLVLKVVVTNTEKCGHRSGISGVQNQLFSRLTSGNNVFQVNSKSVHHPLHLLHWCIHWKMYTVDLGKSGNHWWKWAGYEFILHDEKEIIKEDKMRIKRQRKSLKNAPKEANQNGRLKCKIYGKWKW